MQIHIVRYLRVTIALVVLALASACGSPMIVRVSDPDRNQLKSYPGIRAVHYEAPPLWITTAGRVLLDDYTLYLNSVPNKDYAKRYVITDPAAGIKELLTQALEKEAGFRKFVSVAQPLARGSNSNTEAGKAAYGSGMVLEVSTIDWGGMYFTTNWMRYRLGYVVQARLIRLDGSQHLDNAQVLWKGTCGYNAATHGKYEPSMDELKENNGALLKKIVADAGKYCGDLLVSQFFNRDTK